MRGELSAGLPRLGTADRYVVSLRTGARVRLRGVNRSGLEYAAPDPPGGTDDERPRVRRARTARESRR